MAMQDFAARLIAMVDGRKMDLLSEIRNELESGKIEIYTLETGFAGFSAGPGKVTVTFSGAVPVGGFEENFFQYAANSGRHTVQIGCGALAYTGEGEFVNASVGQSVGDKVQLSATWVGQKKAFK